MPDYYSILGSNLTNREYLMQFSQSHFDQIRLRWTLCSDPKPLPCRFGRYIEFPALRILEIE